MAALLLALDGAGGLHGWQWLFLLEGVPAMALGIAIAALLARDPSSAACLSPEERAWLVARCRLTLTANCFPDTLDTQYPLAWQHPGNPWACVGWRHKVVTCKEVFWGWK